MLREMGFRGFWLVDVQDYPTVNKGVKSQRMDTECKVAKSFCAWIDRSLLEDDRLPTYRLVDP